MSFEETSNPEYSTFIALSKYARWLPDEGRRENWGETVHRYIEFFAKRYPWFDEEGPEYQPSMAELLFYDILELKVMPSMRALMTAGPALERDNVAGFNCAYREMSGAGKTLHILTPEMIEAGMDYVAIRMNKPTSFDEGMYILLCGTGLGFSAERQFISTLPEIGHKLPRSSYMANQQNYPGVDWKEISNLKDNIIEVKDSKYGWASALRILIIELYNGNFNITWNLDEVRPAGEPLKTFGGRASGPEPLNRLFEYCIPVFRKAYGRKLNSIEVHGLICKIAEIVIVGGVRRSALLGLSNLSDDRMRHAKSGPWWIENPEFALANNSICYTEHPDSVAFMREWLALLESGSGERGIFNRVASQRQAARNGRRKWKGVQFGTNPCSEIILLNEQFCNLTEVVAREGDSLSVLKEKVRLATILGTLQATLTDFKYLNPEWKKNTEEEALLGVSITGIMDHLVLSGQPQPLDGNIPYKTLIRWLIEMKEVAVETNKKWAEKLGINQSVAITCIKPSGTVSQLVDSASGIHPRYSEFYIRTVRADKKDPLAKMMIDQGFPHAKDVMNPDNTLIFSFPMRAPSSAIFRNEMTAIDQLEHWLIYQKYWCEHKPSITVYVTDEENMEVGAWVWDHFDQISGISFLPYSDHTYRQAPYQEITEEEYKDWLEIMPEDIDWSEVGNYEQEDNTTSSQTLACGAGGCEIVDLLK